MLHPVMLLTKPWPHSDGATSPSHSAQQDYFHLTLKDSLLNIDWFQMHYSLPSISSEGWHPQIKKMLTMLLLLMRRLKLMVEVQESPKARALQKELNLLSVFHTLQPYNHKREKKNDFTWHFNTSWHVKMKWKEKLT